jgi:4-hydroxy-tetrahydrodipicolinate synthase
MVADRISVICGEEPLLCTTTIMGATGAILATSNVIPRFWKEMLTAIDNDEIAKAVQMHLDIQPFLSTVFSESNPGPLKAALKHAGIDCGDALPPLHAPEKAVAEKLAREMQHIKKWWN